MSTNRTIETFDLTPTDNTRLANLCGQFDQNLRQIERHLGVEINNRGHQFQIIGPAASIVKARQALELLYTETAAQKHIEPVRVHLLLQSIENHTEEKVSAESLPPVLIQTPQLKIQPLNSNQHHYVRHILEEDINFGIGPSGTGKTYLAVACAVAALQREQVRRIILVRPAVEAGEKLGYLPGSMAEKVDPYLRPLYDALYETLGSDQFHKLLEKNVIELAPLAFMRGRTLNESFIILDESQNTTKEQMKMFLTRIGFGSKAVITGDITQIDLPAHINSGLRHAITVLADIPGIHFTFFQAKDVMRHPLVQRIVQAYEKADGH